MLEDVHFILIWLMLPIMWYFLFRVAHLEFTKVSLPSFTIAIFFLLQYIGLPVLYFQFDIYRASIVNDKILILKVMLFTSVTITLMILGFIAANKQFGSLRWPVSMNVTFFSDSLKKLNWKNNRSLIGLFLLFIISFAVLIKYVSIIGFNNLAISFLLNSDLGLGAVARSNMGNAFQGGYHWYKLFMNDFLSFILFAFTSFYLINQSKKNKLILLYLFLVTAFVMVMSVQKAPFGWLLIGMFLVYVTTKYDGDIPFLKSIYLILSLFLILVSFYIFIMGADNIGQAITGVFSRATTGQIMPAYIYLEFFPKHKDFLLGQSFPNPGGIFPFDPYRLTVEIANWFNPNLSKSGIVGSMPTLYWGEMYANFGVLGVIIPPFFVGYILYGLNAIIFRLNKNPLSISLLIWLIIHFKSLAMTGLSNFIFDHYFFGIVIVFLSISFFYGRGNIHFMKSTKFTY